MNFVPWTYSLNFSNMYEVHPYTRLFQCWDVYQWLHPLVLVGLQAWASLSLPVHPSISVSLCSPVFPSSVSVCILLQSVFNHLSVFLSHLLFWPSLSLYQSLSVLLPPHVCVSVRLYRVLYRYTSICPCMYLSMTVHVYILTFSFSVDLLYAFKNVNFLKRHEGT